MKMELFGLKVDKFTKEDAISTALKLMSEEKVSQVVTINPEMFEYASKNQDFTDIVEQSEMVISDGIGVKIALMICGEKVDRIPGIDFAENMLKKSAESNIPVAIIGASQENLDKAVSNLKNKINNLNIVYVHNGYFNNNDEIYLELADKKPRLILVAMGSPKQEYFIYGAKSKLSQGLMIGIGGSIDVWSGNVKRAPLFFQKCGFEWLYRTLLQPERFKRIFPTLPLFILKTIKYKVCKECLCFQKKS